MSEYMRAMRQHIGHDVLVLPSADCLVINDQGQLLLQHRTDTNNWGIPGGILEPTEPLVEGMKRELKEETGLEIVDPTLFAVYSGQVVTYPNGDQCAFVRHVFLSESYHGSLQHDQESLVVGFYNLDDLPGPINATHQIVLSDYQRYRAGECVLPLVR